MHVIVSSLDDIEKTVMHMYQRLLASLIINYKIFDHVFGYVFELRSYAQILDFIFLHIVS